MNPGSNESASSLSPKKKKISTWNDIDSLLNEFSSDSDGESSTTTTIPITDSNHWINALSMRSSPSVTPNSRPSNDNKRQSSSSTPSTFYERSSSESLLPKYRRYIYTSPEFNARISSDIDDFQNRSSPTVDNLSLENYVESMSVTRLRSSSDIPTRDSFGRSRLAPFNSPLRQVTPSDKIFELYFCPEELSPSTTSKQPVFSSSMITPREAVGPRDHPLRSRSLSTSVLDLNPDNSGPKYSTSNNYCNNNDNDNDTNTMISLSPMQQLVLSPFSPSDVGLITTTGAMDTPPHSHSIELTQVVPEPRVVFDDLGFPVPAEYIDAYLRSQEVDKERIRSQIDVWTNYFNNNIKTSVLPTKSMVRDGIPQQFRGRAWMLLSGAHEEMVKGEGNPETCYAVLSQQFVARADDIVVDQIRKDISRTFPMHPQFKAGSHGNQENNSRGENDGGGDGMLGKLRRVLVTYSFHNEHVGYCQGLNFVTAVFLLHLSETETFYILKVLVEQILDGYYSPGLRLLQLDQAVFKDLLEQRLPEMAGKLEELGLPVPVITTRWFMCIYMGTMPTETVMRIWDIFFAEGWKVLFRVALGIFTLNEDWLIRMDDGDNFMSLLKKMALEQYDVEGFFSEIHSKSRLFNDQVRITSRFISEMRKKKESELFAREEEVKKRQEEFRLQREASKRQKEAEALAIAQGNEFKKVPTSNLSTTPAPRIRIVSGRNETPPPSSPTWSMFDRLKSWGKKVVSAVDVPRSMGMPSTAHHPMMGVNATPRKGISPIINIAKYLRKYYKITDFGEDVATEALRIIQRRQPQAYLTSGYRSLQPSPLILLDDQPSCIVTNLSMASRQAVLFLASGHQAWRYVAATSFCGPLCCHQNAAPRNIQLATAEHLVLPTEDVIIANESIGEWRPRFILVVDRGSQCIVVAIGSFGQSPGKPHASSVGVSFDELVDPPIVPHLNGFVHQGVLHGALHLGALLKPYIQTLMTRHPNFSLLITGHALGSALAALISIDLNFDKSIVFKASCITFSPPAILSPSLIDVSREFITSFIHMDDMVPRLSGASFRLLYDEVVSVAAAAARQLDSVDMDAAVLLNICPHCGALVSSSPNGCPQCHRAIPAPETIEGDEMILSSPLLSILLPLPFRPAVDIANRLNDDDNNKNNEDNNMDVSEICPACLTPLSVSSWLGDFTPGDSDDSRPATECHHCGLNLVSHLHPCHLYPPGTLVHIEHSVSRNVAMSYNTEITVPILSAAIVPTWSYLRVRLSEDMVRHSTLSAYKRFFDSLEHDQTFKKTLQHIIERDNQ